MESIPQPANERFEALVSEKPSNRSWPSPAGFNAPQPWLPSLNNHLFHFDGPNATRACDHCYVAFPQKIGRRRMHSRASATKRSGAHKVHNHPSGVAEPSQADELITQRVKAALALVDIRVLDHLIVAGGEVISLAERGAM